MKLGFIVNPVAGMGGRVGLKGTDNVVDEAIRRGAKPVSPSRAVQFLEALKTQGDARHTFPNIVTCRGPMGEDEVKATGMRVAEVLPIPANKNSYQEAQTTAKDTKAAVRSLVTDKVDLLVFVGGDGTARDVMDATKELESSKIPIKRPSLRIPPILGVPSGVKMYSAVFASNPVDAARIVSLYAGGRAEITELEVMDVDEDAFRNDQLSVRLYGYMKCLYVPLMSQASKELSPDVVDEKENQKAIAKTIIEDMDPKGLYILGPGTTVKTLADMLHTKKTTLGVDIYYLQKMIALDVDEKTIINEIRKHGGKKNTYVIVSPIGRQGVVFGRGNQQISPAIIKDIDKDHILILATKTKVRDLDGACLKVDTGDKDVDRMFKGYMKVMTDYREWRMLPVK